MLAFIASYPRSGNTWVRLFVFALMKSLGLVSGDKSLAHFAKYVPWDNQKNFAMPVLRKPPSLTARSELLAARPAITRFMAMALPPPKIAKTHAAFSPENFDAPSVRRAIYLVRNPLEVAPSLAKHLGIPVSEAVEIMRKRRYVSDRNPDTVPDPWGSWTDNVDSWCRAPNTVTLRFEDLVADPSPAFRKIAALVSAQLRRDVDDDKVAQAIDAVALDKLESFESVGGFRSKAPHNSRYFGSGVRQTYRDKLTPEHARSIISVHRRQMQRLGYLDAEAATFAGVSLDDPSASGSERPTIAR